MEENKKLSIVEDKEVFVERHGIRNAHLRFVQEFVSLIKNSTISQYGTDSDAMLVMTYAASLGINPFDALTKISLINGKPVIDAKLQLSILQNMGATMEIIKDAAMEPLFVTPTEDYISLQEVINNRNNFYIDGDNTPDSEKLLRIKISKVQNFLNRVTEIKISYGGKVGTASFSRLEAKKANLLTKTVWVNYEKDMLLNRAIVRCIRTYFSFLLHTYLPSELNEDSDEYILSKEDKEKLFKNANNFTPDTTATDAEYIEFNEDSLNDDIEDSIDDYLDKEPE